ncbi:hypothetical protein PCASD_23690 [Puccinia coronata f. sp. avenae]|uniref:RING-type domain-containing protein n=1 Tax=Puccinia coronata f. sp. avenae TaxID=200324 RepID=A0A2N5SRG2_9BASI|nr:hypothetical protein PCASD_23690 [Puccinia coronata f. sp. avenae]
MGFNFEQRLVRNAGGTENAELFRLRSPTFADEFSPSSTLRRDAEESTRLISTSSNSHRQEGVIESPPISRASTRTLDERMRTPRVVTFGPTTLHTWGQAAGESHGANPHSETQSTPAALSESTSHSENDKSICELCTEEINLQRKYANLRCGHPGCVDCVRTWIMVGKHNCPFCRRDFDEDELAEVLSRPASPPHTRHLQQVLLEAQIDRSVFLQNLSPGIATHHIRHLQQVSLEEHIDHSWRLQKLSQNPPKPRDQPVNMEEFNAMVISMYHQIHFNGGPEENYKNGNQA